MVFQEENSSAEIWMGDCVNIAMQRFSHYRTLAFIFPFDWSSSADKPLCQHHSDRRVCEWSEKEMLLPSLSQNSISWGFYQKTDKAWKSTHREKEMLSYRRLLIAKLFFLPASPLNECWLVCMTCARLRGGKCVLWFACTFLIAAEDPLAMISGNTELTSIQQASQRKNTSRSW